MVYQHNHYESHWGVPGLIDTLCVGWDPANDLSHVNVQNIAISIIHLEYQALTISFFIFATHTFVFCLTVLTVLIHTY